MIRPQPSERICGVSICVARKAAVTFPFQIRSHSSTGNSVNGVMEKGPELLTRMSIVPGAAAIAFSSRRQVSVALLVSPTNSLEAADLIDMQLRSFATSLDKPEIRGERKGCHAEDKLQGGFCHNYAPS